MNWQRADKDELIAPAPPNKGKGRIRAVLALLVLGGLGWYLVDRLDAPAPREKAQETLSLSRDTDDTILPIVREPAVPATPEPDAGDLFADPGQPDGDQARAIIAQLGDAAPEVRINHAYAQAEAFRDAGRLADAYLLYFFAARQGDAASALVLGTMADPARYSADKSFLDAPDMGQAYKWYRAASEQGNATATERLAELRTQVETAAATGDEHARRLLLQWR
jgi:hypothetical protein